MSNFSLKADHFITPIRLVLPGIVVSVIGLFASNYIFNNPNKIKGNSSRTAWDNLKRYENIYRDYTETLPCEYNGNIGQDYSQHLIHLQEMTAENLKMLRDDKDVDKLMAAIINLRIDTYTQLKNSSRSFFDSLYAMSTSISNEMDSSSRLAMQVRFQAIQARMQIKFINHNEHVYKRDSSIINLLGKELSKHYKTFKNVNFNIFNNTADTLNVVGLQKKIIGTWSLITNDIPILLKIDSVQTGSWIRSDDTIPLRWTLEKTSLKMHFIDRPATPDVVFETISSSEKTISFYYKIEDAEGFVIACRAR